MNNSGKKIIFRESSENPNLKESGEQLTWSQIGFFRMSEKGRLIFANQYLVTILGYISGNKLLSKTLRTICFNPEELKKVLELIDPDGNETRINDEIKLKKADDTPILVSITIHPFRKKENEKVIHFEGFVRCKSEKQIWNGTYDFLKYAMDRVKEALFLIDENAHIRYVNENACQVLGYSHDELLQLTIEEIDPDFPYERWKNHWEELRLHKNLTLEGRHKTKDNHIIPVEISANYFEFEGQAYNLGLVRDISWRKQAEEIQIRINRELQAIRECNQILLRAVDENALLTEVCKIICEVGGYRLAWVGYAENDPNKTIRPVARAGFDSGYIEKAELTWSEDRERGRGPAGIVIRTGKLYVVQNFESEPIMAPWRQEALLRGFHSGIVLPLLDKTKKTFGVLMIYSSEKGAITHDEIILMKELADDLSYGIDNLRKQIRLEQTKNDLQKSNDLLKTIINAAPVAIIDMDLDGIVRSIWNPMAEKLSGWSAEQAIGSFLPTIPEDKKEEFKGFREIIRQGGELNGVEVRRKKRDGTPITYSIYASPLHDSENNITGNIAVLVDITTKKIEEEHQQTINKISNVFLSIQDDEMYSEVLSLVVSALECNFGIFGYIDENGDLIVPSLTRDVWDKCNILEKSIIFPSNTWGESLWGRAIREKKSFYSAGPFKTPYGHVEIDNFLTIPILFRDGVIGILSVANKRNGFNNDDIGFLTQISSYISPILNARLQRDRIEKIRRSITEKLFKQERTLRNAQRIAKVGSLEFDLETNSVDISEEFYEIFGILPGEFQNTPEKFLDFISPDDRPEAEVIILKSKDNLQAVDLTRKIQRASDGEIRIIHAISDIIRDDQGRPKTILYTIKDLTEIYNIKESLQEYKLAVDQSPVSIVITNAYGDIEYVNPKFIEITGYQLDEVLGKNPKILQGGQKSKEEYKHLWDTILSGREWTGEFYNKRKNGTYFWELAYISSIKDEDGNITHFIGVKEDISERKKIEEELITAKEKAEEMSRLKSSLLLNMSHELRTPMNGILGYSNLLLEESLEPNSRQMVNIIHSSGKRLMNTLNSIIDLSQVESEREKLKLEITRLGDIIINTQSRFEIEAKQKGLLFRSEIDNNIYAMVDIRLFQNIINHLLDNAIKFTEKGTVSITLSKVEIQGILFASIIFKDTGVGIRPEVIPYIFEEFRQGSEGIGRHFEGLGLGLTLCKRFVELLNGEIFVESIPDIGSTFTVRFKAHSRIPLVIPKADSPLSESLDREKDTIPRLIKPKVLIVEDNKQNCELMEIYLKRSFQIDTVQSGRLALKQVLINQYDIILMDINLGPDMDGIQVTKEIRKFDQYKNIPIVAVTGFSTDEEKEIILRGGLNGILSKPFTRDELIAIVTLNLKF